MAVRIPPILLTLLPVTAARAGRASSLATTSGVSAGESHPMSYTTLKGRVTFEREIKKSKFIAVAAPVASDDSAHAFLSQVRDPRATHNCWAYKLGDHYRSNDDGEPSGTAGKPIYSAIASSGIDMVMVVVIRYFGGIKLGTGGLMRAYGGVTSECLRDVETCVVKSKVSVGVEVPFDLLGSLYHQIQSFQVEDIQQDYDSVKDGFTLVTFRMDYDKFDSLESAVKSNCSRQIDLMKRD